MVTGAAVIGSGLVYGLVCVKPGVGAFLGFTGANIPKIVLGRSIMFIQSCMKTKPAVPKLDSSVPVVEPDEATLPCDIVVYNPQVYENSTTAKLAEDLFAAFKLFLTYE